MSRRWVQFGAIFFLLTAGCSTKLEIASDTCWTGTVTGAPVEGCGNKTWRLRDRGGYHYKGACYTFKKTTSEGSLRARVKGRYGNPRWVETTEPFGSIEVCVSD